MLNYENNLLNVERIEQIVARRAFTTGIRFEAEM